MSFIPANESPLYIRFFSLYTKWKLKRTFEQVWIKQEYTPSDDTKTVYFLNHNSWWDGLIPLYLNEYFFKQNARAIMEDKQMKKHPFFSKIGAFSIDLNDPKASVTSLRYAIESLKRNNACLFIYPEGKIKPASESKPDFKNGLSWLYKKVEEIDFVPIGIYMHSFRSAKPELYISIGDTVDYDNQLNNNELNNLFEHDMQQILAHIRATAGFSDEGFIPQF
ncbi:lysophospholipid acyltransferase family protein [Gracilimonas sp. Q87]|uniref:lysophospholipid acyltransferase family protein n=1 Tax=Gracilimonas sp. Q87 TaxID=3384766 RepID=UPI00398404EA